MQRTNHETTLTAMTKNQALEVLREEFPDYEFEEPDTGQLDLSGMLHVKGDFGTETFDADAVLKALNREGVGEGQARKSLVAFVEKVLEQ